MSDDIENKGSARKRINDTASAGQDTMDTNYQSVVDSKEHGNAGIFKEDSHTRSLLKGVSWRCVATMTTMVVAWFVTGEMTAAFKIGFVEFFLKLGIYYLHERIWLKIRI